MSYEDDELERMRARREQRRNSARSGLSEESRTGRRSSGSGIEGGRSSSRAGDGRGSFRTGAAGDGRSSSRTGAAEGGRRARSEGQESPAFKSGYSGPKGDARKSGRRGEGPAHQRRRAAQRKRRLIIGAEIAAIVVLLAVGVCWYVYSRTFGAMQKIEFNEEEVMNVNLSDEQLEGMKGYFTVACFGVDSRSVNGKMNVGKGTNADVNLIASINLETGEIRLVSVFRDSYLNINDKNSYNKINAAYAQGGPEQAVKALNKNLGLNITQYATFNWKAVADAINILGGVDITISEAEFSWINAYISETVKETGLGSTQLTHAGEVHLDGVQAVAYGRLRLGDTDYARTERQRIILNKAFEKAKAADWVTLNCVIQTVMPQLATNITIADMVPLARNISKYHMGDTAGFPSARGEMDIGKIGDCVVPQTLEFNVRELHKFLFDEADYVVPDNVLQYSEYIAQTTGLTTEGKVIGHVPVDQGISAASYIKRAAQRVSEQAAAEAASRAAAAAATATSEESTSETDETGETDESGTDESSTEDEFLDPDEGWLDDWDEDWYIDWEDGNGATGPGSSGTNGPGSSGNSSGDRYTRPGRPGTTEANENATGPGAGRESTAASRPSRPVTSTTEAETTSRPRETSSGSRESTADANKTNNSGGIVSPLNPGGTQENSGNDGPGGPVGPGA